MRTILIITGLCLMFNLSTSSAQEYTHYEYTVYDFRQGQKDTAFLNLFQLDSVVEFNAGFKFITDKEHYCFSYNPFTKYRVKRQGNTYNVLTIMNFDKFMVKHFLKYGSSFLSDIDTLEFYSSMPIMKHKISINEDEIIIKLDFEFIQYPILTNDQKVLTRKKYNTYIKAKSLEELPFEEVYSVLHDIFLLTINGDDYFSNRFNDIHKHGSNFVQSLGPEFSETIFRYSIILNEYQRIEDGWAKHNGCLE